MEGKDGFIPPINSNTDVVFYNQGVYTDTNKYAYGKGTIKDCGCALCSTAMALAYYLGKEWTVAHFLQYLDSIGGRNQWYVSGKGTDTGGMTYAVATSLGLAWESLPNANAALKHLQQGHLVIMSSKHLEGTNPNDRLYWTGGTHIVLLSGVDKQNNNLIYCHNCGQKHLIDQTYTTQELDRLVYSGFWAFYIDGNTDTFNSKSVQNFANGYNEGGTVAESEYTGWHQGGSWDFDYNASTGQIVGQDFRYLLKSGMINADTIKNPYNSMNYNYEYTYDTINIEYEAEVYKSANQEEDVVNTGLLTYPTLVESPFIQFKVGDYTFGTYTGDKFPNYIDSMTVKKVNGEVNQYTINIRHQIEAGADPNLLDRIFSSAGYGAKVYISYGDYESPSFTYKEEEAILLKVTNNVDFKNSLITYTVSCTSNATQLYANKKQFEKYESAKPSDIIADMLWGSGKEKYGFRDVFPGMYGENEGNRQKFIASDDKEVEIAAKNNIDPLSYLNYLITCMCSVTNTDNSTVLKDSTYKLCLYDENFDDSGYATGAYFKIVKIPTKSGAQSTLQNQNIYEVDIGFPTDNMVMDFSVKTDQSWALLYNYSDQIKEITYNLDNNGELQEQYLPKVAISNINGKMTEAQRTWWTQMTEFPVKASLTIKGLIRPAILMTYVRINALFYGQRHISSGLYIITSQEDSISGAGFRTTLELQRVAGDDDYVATEKRTKQIKVVSGVTSTSSVTETDNYIPPYDRMYEDSLQYIVDPSSDPSLAFYDEQSCNPDSVVTNGISDLGTNLNYERIESVYPIYAALYVATGSADLTILRWALSATLWRHNDLLESEFNLSDNLAQFIHSNKELISYYKKNQDKDKQEFGYSRYSWYSDLENDKRYNQCQIFGIDCGLAFDYALKFMQGEIVADVDYEQIYKNKVSYINSNGQSLTIPTPTKDTINRLYLDIINGVCVTTANYFSNCTTKLTVNGKSLSGQTPIKNSIGNDEYWIPGQTILTDARGVTSKFMAFPPNCSIPFSLSEETRKASDYALQTDPNDDWYVYCWKQCRNHGMSKEGSASLLGNLMYESANRGPTSVEQSGFAKSLANLHKYGWQTVDDVNAGITKMLDKYPNDDIFKEVEIDGEKRTKFEHRRPWFDNTTQFTGTYWGYGIAQWTDYGRKMGLVKKAHGEGKSVGDIKLQVDYVLYELSNKSQSHWYNLLGQLQQTSNITASTEAVMCMYEMNYQSVDAAHKSQYWDGFAKSLPGRIECANDAYQKYKNL